MRQSSALNLTLNVPFEYYVSDYCGKDTREDSCSTTVKSKIRDIYTQTFPSNLDSSSNFNGFYSKSQRGGILFLNLDSTSFFNVDKGTIFGADQIQFITETLKSAATDDSVKAIVITSNQPWNYVKSAYDKDSVKTKVDSLEDNVIDEKYQFSNATSVINFSDETAANYKPLMMVIGEHFTSFDQGNNNNFGGFPILSCGSVNDASRCQGGPYSHGYSNVYKNQYCMLKGYSNPNITDVYCLEVKAYYTHDMDEDEDTLVTWDSCKKQEYLGVLNVKCPINFREKILHAFILIIITAAFFLFFYVFLYKLAEKKFDYLKVSDKEE